MYQILNRKLIMTVICALISSQREGTSIILSPSGTTSVCPGGQVLLTCERMSGYILSWIVSISHVDTTLKRFVLSSGGLLSPEFRIGFTEFNITRISESPLISQLLINNVTAETTVYCSEDDAENNAPMIVIYKDDALLGPGYHSLNISLVNQLLRNNDVTVTLQWPREAGAVYYISVLPDTPHTEFTNAMSPNSIRTNIAISYNIQYNVSILSSLCGVITTKVLHYVACGHPPTQLLHDHGVIMVTESDTPKREGQSITFTCSPGFILTGPNASVCTGNGEWEPDPGQVDCIADCGVPLAGSNVKPNYTSTLEGAALTFTCETEISNISTINESVFEVICDSSGNWIPDPDVLIRSCSSSFTEIQTESSVGGSGVILIIGVVLGVLIFVAMAIIFTFSAILCLIKKGHQHPNPNRINRSLYVNRGSEDIKLENTYNIETTAADRPEPPAPQQQGTVLYAKIGPSSFKKRAKPVVTLRPNDIDDRVEYAQLNHSIQKPIIQTKQDYSADDCLNLDTLLIQIRGAVTSRWYQLGEVLEVNKDVLDRCSNYPPEESIVEILEQWLRNFPGHPTWHDVTNALRRTGLQQLANNIEMVYETGKLPIPVDDNNDIQRARVLTTTAQPEEEKTKTTNHNVNSHHDQDESAPPLPPKPCGLAGSDVPKTVSFPPRPSKFAAK